MSILIPGVRFDRPKKCSRGEQFFDQSNLTPGMRIDIISDNGFREYSERVVFYIIRPTISTRTVKTKKTLRGVFARTAVLFLRKKTPPAPRSCR